MIKSIIFFLSVFYFGLHIFGEGGARAYLIFIATAPRELAFPMRIIQEVFAVAIFFFVGVGDIKHLLSQTQLFNKDFFERNEKRAAFGEKNSLKTALK